MAAFLRSALPQQRSADAMSVAAARACLEHAALLCKSRAFCASVSLVGGMVSGGVAGDGPADAGDARERRLLVPLLDLLNHSSEPARVCSMCRVVGGSSHADLGDEVSPALGHDEGQAEQEEGVVELVASRRIAAGSAVCMSYGGYSSAECLERFGFVDALPDRPASEGDDLAALCAVSPTLARAPEPPA